MMGRIKYSSTLVFIFFNFFVLKDRGVKPTLTVSTKNQPSLITRDGHLVLNAGNGRNISFETSGAGCVNINGENLVLIAKMARNASEVVERLRVTRLASLEQTVQGLSSAMEGPTGMKRRLAMVEEGANNGTGGGGGRRPGKGSNGNNLALRNRITSTVRRVFTLERQVRELRSLLTMNECNSNPCKNGGTCEDNYNAFFCRCLPNWTGLTCDQDVNECHHFTGTDLGCQNGATCINKPGTYQCTCSEGWFGVHCTQRSNDCSKASSRDLCGHGICVSQSTASGYTCICDQGWTTDSGSKACTKDIDECAGKVYPCSHNPRSECINVDGSFFCSGCPAGFTGNGYYCSDLDECQTNNGGCSPLVQCINTHGSRVCGSCPPGYQGDGGTCSFAGRACSTNNGGCHLFATCQDNAAISSTYVSCTCRAGYTGSGIGPLGCIPYSGGNVRNACLSNPCRRGSCIQTGTTFRCLCPPGFTGTFCTEAMNGCASSPCLNGANCTNVFGAYRCSCAAGFSGATCADQKMACGGALKTQNGTIKFPSAGMHYEDNLSCAWRIQVNSSYVVNVTFKNFHLESSSDCSNDFMQVHDGRTAADPSIGFGKFCGRIAPNNGKILSTGNSLYIWFRSDSSISHSGFELDWYAVLPVCGTTITTTSHGSLNSPGSPGKYPPNRDCYWTINAPLYKRLQFHFVTLMLNGGDDCDRDYLAFHDGALRTDPVIAKYCNTSSPAPLVMPGNAAIVHFHSDATGSDMGFQIAYSVIEGIPGCGGVMTAPIGDIVPPRDPETNKYKHAMDCVWKIQQPVGETIKLSFTSFHLEESRTCTFDYLEIREGPNEESPLVNRFCGKTLPRDYDSIGNVLYIRFRSDWSTSYEGFHVKYKSICGGEFATPTGVITSPFYPNPYPDSRTCIYRITQPVGKAIKLQFLDFDIEDNSFPTCNFDYLQIRDGDNDNSTVVGQYCGGKGQFPPDVLSTHNYLWLQFNSDSFIRNRGFKANYSTIDILCGGILRDTHGIITSPSDREKYPNNLRCSWVIVAPPGHIVQLTFITFSLEYHPLCNRDYVEIFDNSTIPNTGGSMGKYCAGTLPPVLMSLDRVMNLVFVTDSSLTKEGFTASYITMDASRMCGGNMYTTSGVIASPNYPGNYLHDKDCTWVIQVPPGQQIMLNVTDFLMEAHYQCNFDYLEIKNGGFLTSPLIGKYCGTNIPKMIPSFSNQLYLRFVSDSSRSSRGFRITWDGTATGCGATLTAPTGSITTPNYPAPYGRNAECYWHISVSQGSTIQLIFVDLELESHTKCRLDYVQLHEGLDTSGKLIGRYCSSHPTSIVTKGHQLYIKFRSDVSQEGRGFHFKYATVCDTTVTGYRGVIESPNFPRPYPGDLECTWIVKAPLGNKINMTFSHFSTEVHDPNTTQTTKAVDPCDYDYLEIREGTKDVSEPTDRVLGRFCGTELPDPVASSKDHVYIHFKSDALVADIGFRLEWIIEGCGGHLDKPAGMFTSPGYPNPYPTSLVCEWLITAPFDQSVQLNVTDLALERSKDNCNFDSLQVYNSEDDKGQLIGNLCHSPTNKISVTTTGNSMFVRFTSDWSFVGRGFKASYSIVPSRCGGHLLSPKGSFHSLNYPQNYGPNDDCYWLIEVDKSHVIRLSFSTFDIEFQSNCTMDYVRVYDGNSTSAPKLMDHCGSELPSPSEFVSTTNQLFVHFKTDGSLSAKGFLANYTIACGARIVTETSGLLSIRDEMNAGGNNKNCSWVIVGARPEDRVSLTITHMDVSPIDDNESNECEYYFVEVLNGETLESPRIGGQMCGTRSPPRITSSGNAMVVHMVALEGGHYGNFEATYSVLSNACGGNMTSEFGTFATPNYPSKYPMGVECVWNINTAPGNRAQISFSSFDLVQSESCNDDYVEIREGGALGKMVGVYCTDIPGNVTASNKLWIKFRSGGTGVGGGGFVAEYALVHGNELTGDQGQIASPLYPHEYIQTGEFNWRITVRFGYAITITFKEFYIDKMLTICSFYLAVYDGFDETAPELLKACGSVIPDPITSTSNVVYIRLVSDPMRQGTIFFLDWLRVDKVEATAVVSKKNVTGCGGLVDLKNATISQTAYLLASPGYPHGYEGKLDCDWIFETTPGFHLEMTFLDLQLEAGSVCQFDNVQIYRGRRNLPDWQLVKTFCHPNATQERVIYSSNLMKVIFHTDFYVNKTGFIASVKATCGGSLRSSNGQIEATNTTMGSSIEDGRGSSVFIECQWNITVKPGRKVSIKFTRFEIEKDAVKNECGDNYIILKNGGSAESPLLGNGKYCSSVLPPTLETTGNRAYIKYRGRRLMTNGFRLVYREVSQACGESIILTADNLAVNISSPNYPNIPASHTECQWVIMAPAGESLRLDFLERFDLTRSLDCSKAAVEVRDGGTRSSKLLGNYCFTKPGTLSSSGNIMHVRFFTDVPDPKNGFKAQISVARCGGTIRDWRGTITTPKHPASYPPNIDCQWRIIIYEGHVLNLNFSLIDLTNMKPSNCKTGDYIIVTETDPGNGTVNVLGTYCGENNAFLRSSSNEVLVTFHSGSTDTQRLHRGFKLEFNSSEESCGGALDTPLGVIQSPRHTNLAPVRACQWFITVPRGRRITAKIIDFDIGITLTQFSPRLSFYNDLSYKSRIVSYNGRSSPLPVKSSGNTMLISMIAYRRSGHRGFKLTYSSDEPSVCGDSHLPNATAGVIRSPSTSLNITSFYCFWDFVRPAALNQTLTFTLVNGTFGKATTNCEYSKSALLVQAQETMNLAQICSNNTIPFTVRSPYAVTNVKAFESSDTGNVDFFVRYSTSPCGGLLSGPEDIVSSPGYPGIYPANMDCAWAVTYPSGQAVQIQFLGFDLEKSDNCDRDYLLVRNGPLPSSPLIGRYCGGDVPTNFQSQSNTVWLDFHSDSANQKTGFSLIMRPVVSGCGGTFHSSKGEIFSPGFPLAYASNAECEWEIRVSDGYTVQLTFLDRFFIEQSAGCVNDFIEVSENVNGEWKSLGRSCGREVPAPFNTTTNRMRVLFRSNSAVAGDGFRAIWGVKCGGVISGGKKGQLISPGYPVGYNSMLSCNYTILAPNQMISVSFPFFNLEQGLRKCSYDNVTLYGFLNQWTKVVMPLGTYCGNTAPPPRMFKNQLTLIFSTDQFLERKGFLMKYEIISCGGELNQPGVFGSPQDTTGYIGNLNCTWTITAPANQVVALRFSRLELEHSYHCHYDSIQVFEGPRINRTKQIAHFCGNLSSTPPLAKSTTNQMTVQYTVATHKPQYVFSAAIAFTYDEKVGCGGSLNVTGSPSTLRSPDVNNDNRYEDYSDCHWLITAPVGQTVKLQFDSIDMAPCYNTTWNVTVSKECTCDFLEVRDGSSQISELMGRYCAVKPISPLVSSGSVMWVRFSSDDINTATGFKATVKSVPSICGSPLLNVTNVTQVLTSPGWPGNYPANVRCRWLLSNPLNVRFDIRFDELDIDDTGDCADSLTLVDTGVRAVRSRAHRIRFPIISQGTGSSIVRFGQPGRQISITRGSRNPMAPTKFCGRPKPMDYYSETNNLAVTFMSDEALSRKGFKLLYSVAGCNRNYTGVQGRILLERLTDHCYMTITAPANHTISLYFASFLYHSRTGCSLKALEVRDGKDGNAPSLAKMCGYVLPSPVFSTGPSLYLHTWRDVPVFDATDFIDMIYTTTDKGRGCGGQFFNYGGTFTSPLYPNNYRNSSVCRWDVSAPTGQVPVLKLTTFDIGSKTTCETDFLEFIDIDSETGVEYVRSRYCGGDNPSVFAGKSGTVAVRYTTSVHNGGTGWVIKFMSLLPGANILDGSASWF